MTIEERQGQDEETQEDRDEVIIEHKAPTWKIIFRAAIVICVALFLTLAIGFGLSWVFSYESRTMKADLPQQPPLLYRDLANEPPREPEGKPVTQKSATPSSELDTKVKQQEEQLEYANKNLTALEGAIRHTDDKVSALQADLAHVKEEGSVQTDSSPVAKDVSAPPFDFDAHPELWASWYNGGAASNSTLSIFWTHCQSVTKTIGECFGKVTGAEGKEFAFWGCDADVQDNLGGRAPIGLMGITFGTNYRATLHYGSFINFSFRYVDPSGGRETLALPTMCIEFDGQLGKATADHQVAMN